MWSIADKNFPMIIIIITSTRAQSTFHCSSGFFFLPSSGHCSFLHGSQLTRSDRRVSVERHIKTLPGWSPKCSFAAKHTHPNTYNTASQARSRRAGRQAGSVTKSLTLHQLLKHSQKFFGDICVLRSRGGGGGGQQLWRWWLRPECKRGYPE